MTHLLYSTARTVRQHTRFLSWTPPAGAAHPMDLSTAAIMARARADVLLIAGTVSDTFTHLAHHARHHNQELPAASAMHTAYDHRRRARRARGRRRSR